MITIQGSQGKFPLILQLATRDNDCILIVNERVVVDHPNLYKIDSEYIEQVQSAIRELAEKFDRIFVYTNFHSLETKQFKHYCNEKYLNLGAGKQIIFTCQEA